MVVSIRYIASVIVWVIVALAAVGSIGELELHCDVTTNVIR